MPRGKRGKKSHKDSGDSTLKQLISSHHVTGQADVHTVPEDLKRRQGNWMIGNLRVPRRFLDQIHWIQSTVKSTITMSSTGSVVEANQSFSLQNNVNDYSSYTTVFDQFCIFAANVALVAPQLTGTASAGAASANFGRVYTAIDYDNVTNLGTETAMMEYNSCSVTQVTPGRSHERVVKPTVDVSLYSSSYGVGRFWVDSQYPGTIHYGIRCMTAGNNVGATLGLDMIITVIVGFRNNI
jgi:hypothetical protein